MTGKHNVLGLFLLICFGLISLYTEAQIRPIAKDEVDLENFYAPLVVNLFKKEIADMRQEAGVDSLIQHEVFNAGSQIQADWMKDAGRASTTQRDDKHMETTALRMASVGGNANADMYEFAVYGPVGRGRSMYTYHEVVEGLMDNVLRGRGNEEIINNPDYTYTGLAVTFDPDRKRVYLSFTLGESDAVNLGPRHVDELRVPYSSKDYGLEDFESNACKDAGRFYDYETLHEGIFVEDRNIYIEYGDFDRLKQKLLKNPDDGFAVDVIQREQYECGRPNIYDKTLKHKGIMTKPLLRDKFIEFNCIEDESANRYLGKLGELPKGIEGDYELGDFELNLLVIQDERICQTIQRSYTEKVKVKAPVIVRYLPDTFIAGDETRFVPKREQRKLEFKVPFEQGKHEYDPDDIQPFIEALDQPDFTINEIYIIANSSLEGESSINSDLQRRRAKSIIDALQDYYESDELVEDIKTDDSWELFKKQLTEKNGYKKYRHLADSSKEAVRRKLNRDSALYANLEPLLQEQRFANIAMDVTVDLSGTEARIKYFDGKMKTALDNNNIDEALAIQRYMIDRVLAGRFDSELLLKYNFPENAAFSMLRFNKLWAQNRFSKKNRITEEMCEMITALRTKVPENMVLAFNDILCEITHNPIEALHIDSIQQRIDALYNAPVAGKAVDALNIKFQLKIIDALDVKDRPSTEVVRALRKIQNLYKPEDMNRHMALRISNIFSRFNDYKFAYSALSPFIEEGEIEELSEDFLFTYISLAAKSTAQGYSSTFRTALNTARQKNTDRYCELFGFPFLSFQLLDDPYIKKVFCRHCY